jgi:hypothetical protein
MESEGHFDLDNNLGLEQDTYEGSRRTEAI